MRDPSGRLFDIDGRLIRFVSHDAAEEAALALRWVQSRHGFAQGRVIDSRIVAQDAGDQLAAEVRELCDERFTTAHGLVIEHQRIAWASYPFEWPPVMLHEAAVLTLDLAEEALSAGLGLKDATPYNVLFDSTEPVFVDLLSFERRTPRDFAWLPYGQFVRTFILPLLLEKYLGLPLAQTLSNRRDGPSVDDVHRWCRGPHRLAPGLITTVTVPALLNHFVGADTRWLYKPVRAKTGEEARFVLTSLFRRLRRLLRRAMPAPARSNWTNYSETTAAEHQDYACTKNSFVSEAIARLQPSAVFDVGCNTGNFSRMAAAAGAHVVAIDSDAEVVGRMWREARQSKASILPLVVDIARPSPALGWMNAETQSFIERASGRFDVVLMLAVIHHLLVTDGIPLDEILTLCARLTRRAVIIEYVSPDDQMFQRLTRGRSHLYTGLTRQVFEQACLKHFEICQSMSTRGSTRWLYVLERRA